MHNNGVKFTANQIVLSQKVVKHNFVVILVFLFVIFVLLFFCYKSKNRINKDLSLKQEQINEQNISLKKLLLDKEWLLKELHDRVKNNLQIVISLLNTQSAYLDNKEALLAIQNSQNRMYVMAIIHQKLYQNENLSTIDMNWYIPELANYLKNVFDTDNKIAYNLDIESVELDVVQAIPLGLILNEAIVNAIQYAYPKVDRGAIDIQLRKIKEEEYQLIISDHGAGVPDDFDFKNRNTFGINLMQGLITQLEGTFTIEKKNGLSIIIHFKKAAN
ncbi:hypothetical protein IRZ71_04235 [Flavobacterium sp. ANB]|uniref:sensor histidine kinase n=1 Tax=unclassified Flavobacterium TaxID=196869 RepID=UPI00188D04AD|nr:MULTISPECIES: histidine kinase dimerization/phosphoacceptor domain -containing protein [unclassified Flavobacterium]MBF4515534.1 hypothetical protein [Flavobacterium sp. ANB]